MIQIYIESKTFHLETVLNHGESFVYCHELPYFFIDNKNYLSCIGASAILTYIYVLYFEANIAWQ